MSKETPAPKRRFVSTSTNMCVMEAHEERRDFEGKFFGFVTERLGPDQPLREDRELLKARFIPGLLAVPAGIQEYEYVLLGFVESDDPFIIGMLEAEAERARQRNTPGECREYPREVEEQVKASGVCVGDGSRRRVRQALREAGVRLEE